MPITNEYAYKAEDLKQLFASRTLITRLSGLIHGQLPLKVFHRRFAEFILVGLQKRENLLHLLRFDHFFLLQIVFVQIRPDFVADGLLPLDFHLANYVFLVIGLAFAFVSVAINRGEAKVGDDDGDEGGQQHQPEADGRRVGQNEPVFAQKPVNIDQVGEYHHRF